MKVPTWLAVIGAFECGLGLWGLLAIWSVLAAPLQVNTAARVGLAVAAAMAAASVGGGWLLARRRARAAGVLAWVLGAQTWRIATPGVVWLVSLGWAANVVVYAGRAPQPEGQDVAVMVGSHPLGGYLAINLVAAVPWLATVAWMRASRAASARAERAPAV